MWEAAAAATSTLAQASVAPPPGATLLLVVAREEAADVSLHTLQQLGAQRLLSEPVASARLLQVGQPTSALR